MGRQKSEKSHFDMANRIYAQTKDKGAELYRLFRVYHPVYEISVNIETEQIEDNYHIIEKYMDKLVCGYIEENRTLGDGIFIKSKDELFELLGIDRQAYEIADRFYNDLIQAGHFTEIPGVGIRGLKAAHESIKLKQRVNSATVKQRKLFDQFSAKLMPGEFYDFQKYSCKRDSLNEENPLLRNSVWLEPNVTILNSNADIEPMLGNFSYVGEEQIERGLPQGFQSMSIAKDEPIEMSFYPYYLAIFKNKSEFEYLAFRVDNGQPIDWIGSQYRTGYYRSAVELFKTLADVSEQNVKNPINLNFNITSNGAPDFTNGVTRDETTGNYDWKVQDRQLEDLLGLGRDQKFKRAGCLMIANNEIICLTSYEAGKIVRIIKSSEQKKLLLAAAATSLSVDERKDLFTAYTNSLARVDPEIPEHAEEESVMAESAEESVVEEEVLTTIPSKEEKQMGLSDASYKKRIEEAMKLYYQKRYLEAMETFVEFAERDSDCSFNLGYMYGNGRGVSKDAERACYWYKISARLGNRTAKLNLGRRYQKGNGVQKDESKAVELFKDSASQGELDAMYELACCYDKGKGTAKNETQALSWYKKAIEAGRNKDYLSIASLLYHGSTEVRDYKEAAKYYELSLEEGCVIAGWRLGDMYYSGFGVEENQSKAIHYYEIAASKGGVFSMKKLAQKYELYKNLTKALEWFEKAASKGNTEAKKEVERVKKLIAEKTAQSRIADTQEIIEEVPEGNINQEGKPALDKEHSMLNAFVDFMSKGKKGNYEVCLERNVAVWTVSTEKLQRARFVISFKPETNADLQYAFIRLCNYVYFPAEKKDAMYKVCNEANVQFNGLDFFVDESDNSITINMRSAFTKELCGQLCLADIYSLLQAADKVYPLFMKAIWA